MTRNFRIVETRPQFAIETAHDVGRHGRTDRAERSDSTWWHAHGGGGSPVRRKPAPETEPARTTRPIDDVVEEYERWDGMA